MTSLPSCVSGKSSSGSSDGDQRDNKRGVIPAWLYAVLVTNGLVVVVLLLLLKKSHCNELNSIPAMMPSQQAVQNINDSATRRSSASVDSITVVPSSASLSRSSSSLHSGQWICLRKEDSPLSMRHFRQGKLTLKDHVLSPDIFLRIVSLSVRSARLFNTEPFSNPKGQCFKGNSFRHHLDRLSLTAHAFRFSRRSTNLLKREVPFSLNIILYPWDPHRVITKQYLTLTLHWRMRTLLPRLTSYSTESTSKTPHV